MNASLIMQQDLNLLEIALVNLGGPIVLLKITENETSTATKQEKMRTEQVWYSAYLYSERADQANCYLESQ